MSIFDYVSNDPATVRRQLRDLRARRFPVLSASLRNLPTPVGVAEQFPIVLTRSRTDLLNLITRHTVEPGYCTSRWLTFKTPDPHSSIVLLDVHFSAPMRLSFTLEFNLIEHLAFLERCYQLGFIGLSYAGASDPLASGVSILGLEQPGFKLILDQARNEVQSWK